MIRLIAFGAGLFTIIATVLVEAAQTTPPPAPTRTPPPLTLDLLNSEITQLQDRVTSDERQIAQLDARLAQLETQVGGRRFSELQAQVQELQKQLQQVRADFNKHTHTYQTPKFGTLSNVSSVLNNPNGFKNYGFALFSPEQMKVGGHLEVTVPTGPAKY